MRSPNCSHFVRHRLENNNLDDLKTQFNVHNVNDADSVRWTVLHDVCVLLRNVSQNITKDSLIGFLRYLLRDCKANPNVRTCSGRTPFHMVLDSLDCLQLDGLQHLDTQFTRVFLQTYVKELLTAKANINSVDNLGNTPLDILSISTVHKQFVWDLLECGAKFSNTRTRNAIYSQMVNGRNAARKAAVILVGIRRYRFSVFHANNHDVARLISQMVWQSRIEYKEWAT